MHGITTLNLTDNPVICRGAMANSPHGYMSSKFHLPILITKTRFV